MNVNMIGITLTVMVVVMFAIMMTVMITIAFAMNMVRMIAMTSDDRDHNGADQTLNDDQPQAVFRIDAGASPADGC